DLVKGKSVLPTLEVIEALFQNKEAGRILRSPAMPLDLKSNLLNYANEKANAPAEVRAFSDTIVGAGRVELLPEVIAVFRELLNEAAGVVDARVRAAAELSEQDKKEIEAAVMKIVGKRVNVVAERDPSLLGGFVVNVGNRSEEH